MGRMHRGREGGDEVKGAMGASSSEAGGLWKDLAFILSPKGATRVGRGLLCSHRITLELC